MENKRDNILKSLMHAGSERQGPLLLKIVKDIDYNSLAFIEKTAIGMGLEIIETDGGIIGNDSDLAQANMVGDQITSNLKQSDLDDIQNKLRSMDKEKKLQVVDRLSTVNKP